MDAFELINYLALGMATAAGVFLWYHAVTSMRSAESVPLQLPIVVVLYTIALGILFLLQVQHRAGWESSSLANLIGFFASICAFAFALFNRGRYWLGIAALCFCLLLYFALANVPPNLIG